MRVFGILAILLLLVAGLFLYHRSDMFFGSDPQGPVETADPSGADSSATGAGDGDTAKAVEQRTVSAAKVIEKNLDDTSDAEGKRIALARPSFDIIRIDQNCDLVAAGRAEPEAVVAIYIGADKTGEVTASVNGEWVFTSSKPLPSGSQTVNLSARNPDGEELESGSLVIMNVPDCTIPVEDRVPAIAMLVPKDDVSGAVAGSSAKLLQVPDAKGDVSAAKDLSLGAINYDDKGTLELSGRGQPGNRITVYVNNKPVGTAEVDSDGNWSLVPDESIPAGNHTLRIDQQGADGKIISRVELPFQKTPASDVVLAQASGGLSAIVQPGNSLWRIARRVYGEGVEYTVIYQANQDQIRDPDLIYPGQIFTLPKHE
ncbi:LysM peptidoglycan-binding domain-containing protein [Sneathiella sp.]|uniref:LysM peptidoglycan-binding domain-containing protein n=1 Tax=Sneathiella sp. TaxID=1964365 RepID=UPI002616D28D|nr:LysM peptidoglycan-binding domain-containing protein [Sneathiella sp.]MDF2368901.1 Ig-like domain-containing protein [Sneathiella sp.]